jgi:sulfate transport system ATP-binding protein
VSIKALNVSKAFGEFQALQDVTVEIEPGRLVAVLGPSGGGKSTLLRVIAGLETPDSGRVLIDGADVTGLPARRRGIGFVFQHYAAFSHMTVRQNVAFGLRVAKAPKPRIAARVDELLELVHLDGLADRYPGQLSGGQRQRMALARALAVEPELLLLDEPFGALDVKVRQELRDWLRRLHDEVHATTIFVTHDQEEAMEIADEIIVINAGRVEQAGPPGQLYDQPATDFVMGFLGPVTRLGGRACRPHDIEVSTTASPGGHRARVERIVSLGFEIRLTATTADDAAPVTVQLTRGQSRKLDVTAGDEVWLRVQAMPAPLPRSAVSPASVLASG